MNTSDKDARFIKACYSVLVIKANLLGTTPQAKPDKSKLDELYLSQYFTEDVTKLPKYQSIPLMRPSIVHWYVKKYKRQYIFDPFVLGGERLIGAIISQSRYLGVNNYYPMQKCYDDIIDTYDASDVSQVIHSKRYQDIFRGDSEIDMVFTHIPIWEDACMIVSYLWRYSKEDMLIVLHFDEDNIEHLSNVERLCKVLPGRDLLVTGVKTTVYHTQTILTLKRADLFNLGDPIPPVKVTESNGRLIYTLKSSPLKLAMDRYFEPYTNDDRFSYIAVGHDKFALELSEILKGRLTIYNRKALDKWTANRISGNDSVFDDDDALPALSDTILVTDPVFSACLYEVIDRSFPSEPAPSRVWIELDNITYLNCLLIKWPDTTFIICSRNWSVDLSVTQLYGPSKQGRVIVYQLTGKEKLDDYVNLYAQPDDAIIYPLVTPKTR